MSRTNRHRPYWVQAAEHGTDEFHQHELLGQPKTRWRKKRDARGRVIMALQPKLMTLQQAAYLLAGRTDKTSRRIRSEALSRLAAGEPLYEQIEGPDLIDQPVYEEHVLGHYADYCTLHTPQDRDHRVAGHTDLYAPCSRDLDREDAGPAFSRSAGAKRAGYYRDWRQKSRRAVRTASRTLSKDADTWENTDLDTASVFSN